MESEGLPRARPPKIGYSYPSSQARQGPAPLASFEDLPSDDQASPDTPVNLSPDVEVLNEGLDLNTRDFLRGKRGPEQSDEKRRSSGVSTATLTPTGLLPGNNIETSSGSDRSNEVTGLRRKSSPDKKCNALHSPSSPHEVKPRKSSWTDLLFRGRSRSKSPVDIQLPINDVNKKRKGSLFSFFTKKGDKKEKSRLERLANDQLRAAGSIPRVEVNEPTEDNPPEEDEDWGHFTPVNADFESPVEELKALCSDEGPQEINPTSPTIVKQIAVIPKRRKLKKRDTVDSDISECQSLPGRLPSARRLLKTEGTDEQIPDNEEELQEPERLIRRASGDEEDDDEIVSSASESTLSRDGSVKKVIIKARHDDYEVRNLLEDATDFEEHSSCEPLLNPPCLSASREEGDASNEVNQSGHKLRKQRIELMTIPVDRPRSTTPVAIAPLEEYLRRASLSPGPSAILENRIRLSLPGEQFEGVRMKGPRKSNPQIWLDFCEKAVVSPKAKKTVMNWKDIELDSNDPERKPSITTIPAALTPHDAFTPLSDAPLTPITPLDDLKIHSFGDSFDPKSSNITNNDSSDIMKKVVIPSECESCMCKHRGKGLFAASSHGSSHDPDSPLIESFDDPNAQERQVLIPPTTNNNFDTAGTEDEPLMSPNACQCECHRHGLAVFLRSQSVALTLRKHDSILSASSEVSSASSRVIQSSGDDEEDAT